MRVSHHETINVPGGSPYTLRIVVVFGSDMQSSWSQVALEWISRKTLLHKKEPFSSFTSWTSGHGKEEKNARVGDDADESHDPTGPEGEEITRMVEEPTLEWREN